MDIVRDILVVANFLETLITFNANNEDAIISGSG